MLQLHLQAALTWLPCLTIASFILVLGLRKTPRYGWLRFPALFGMGLSIHWGSSTWGLLSCKKVKVNEVGRCTGGGLIRASAISWSSCSSPLSQALTLFNINPNQECTLLAFHISSKTCEEALALMNSLVEVSRTALLWSPMLHDSPANIAFDCTLCSFRFRQKLFFEIMLFWQ